MRFWTQHPSALLRKPYTQTGMLIDTTLSLPPSIRISNDSRVYKVKRTGDGDARAFPTVRSPRYH